MTSQSEPLLKLSKSQIKPASRMLSRAFRDDPITAYTFPERGGEDPKLPYIYEFALRLSLKDEYIYTTSSRLEGVAVWTCLKTSSHSFWKELSSGALFSNIRVGRRVRQKMKMLSQYLDKKHKELISGTHWHLRLLGVDPEHQGKGFASRLLRGMLTRIDEERLPSYLATELAENVLIYEHFGFKTLEECQVPGTTLKIWLMSRPATAGNHI